MSSIKASAFSIGIMMFVLIASVASAHSPLGSGDGQTLATATYVPDPAKSWAIYSSLEEAGDAQYFYFDIEEGEKIYVSLFIAEGSKDSGFLPEFALMGPGFIDSEDYENDETLPNFIEEPSEDHEVIIVPSTMPTQGTYEPFSPGGYYELSEIDIDANSTGDYYIVVFSDDIKGNYGLAVGYLETFTIDEWIFLPFNLISIYEWSGQNIILVLAPILFVLILGSVGLYRRFLHGKAPKTLLQWMIGISGLLALSWGASVVFQMAMALSYCAFVSEVVITIGFAAISIFIAIYMLQTAQRESPNITRPTGILFIVFGGLMIGFLSGFLFGPILAIAAGIMTLLSKDTQAPAQNKKNV